MLKDEKLVDLRDAVLFIGLARPYVREILNLIEEVERLREKNKDLERALDKAPPRPTMRHALDMD